jgi:hydroxymethylpyrimidine pyrophosphatase-like HAD family hydrolase
MSDSLPPSQFPQPLDLVICDIDGCLTPETSEPFDLVKLQHVAAYNRRALETGDGPPITVCTGRPEPFTEAMCRLIGNRQIPGIAENGVWLYFPGTNEYVRDPAIGPTHLEAVHEAQVELNRRFGAQGVAQQPGKTASVTLYHPDTEYLRNLLPEVRTVCEQQGWPFRVTMTWLYINCDLEFVSKASGIRRLFAATALRPEKTLGIGDTASDLLMADIVGAFACPANATDETKARARYVSPYQEVDGVLDILRIAWGGGGA